MSGNREYKGYIMLASIDGEEVELRHCKPTPRARKDFIAALNQMPKSAEETYHMKILTACVENPDFLASAAGEDKSDKENIRTMQALAKEGVLTKDDLLALITPTSEETEAAKVEGLLRMFRAIVDTSTLSEKQKGIVLGGSESGFYQDEVDIAEVESFINSFRRISRI